MTMIPTFLAGTIYVMHAAGWLESGLVSCYEKFIVDIEVLRMLTAEFAPLEVSDGTLAFGAHEEVGHGGGFLRRGAPPGAGRGAFFPPALSLPGERCALQQ